MDLLHCIALRLTSLHTHIEQKSLPHVLMHHCSRAVLVFAVTLLASGGQSISESRDMHARCA